MTETEYIQRLRTKAQAYLDGIRGTLDREAFEAWHVTKATLSAKTFRDLCDAWLERDAKAKARLAEVDGGELVNVETGERMPSADAGEIHARLLSGEMSIDLAPGVAEQLAAAGITLADVKTAILTASKKGMS